MGGHRERAEATVRTLFRQAGITVDGSEPHDLRVNDPRFFPRILAEGSLGLGESYVEGWWDADAVDAFICRVLTGGLARRARGSPRVVALALQAKLLNLQRKGRASLDVRSHYEQGLDLFRTMLDARMIYSCGYWRDAHDLDAAQEAKLLLTCRKLGLRPGMRLLDIGCGWGGLVRFAAERFGVRATGITLSPEQAEVAREACEGLPVEIRVQDFREVEGRFDAVVSVGMFEHVGPRNHPAYMAAVDRCLAPGGLSLLHTIGGNQETGHIDPWIHRYVFPGGHLPTLAQVARAAEGRFVIEDVHNFGPDYDRTLMAWHERLEAGWGTLADRYDETFRRAWRYYLLCCAGAFRARFTQLFQVVLSRPGTPRGHLRTLEPPARDPGPVGRGREP